VVAVIDTGYRPHADLAANIVGGYDFISTAAVGNDGNGRDSDALDPGDATIAGECAAGEPAYSSSWHGTHVAGTIAALTNNGAGVAGVAYGAKVLPVRVLGKCGGYTSDIADGVVWAAGGAVSGVPANAHPARVLNLSLGGGGSCGTTMQNAINTARSRGAVVVVAAGNSNTNASNATPANCAGVVTVAATNRSGGRSYYSNYGTVVDIAAPGGDMRSAATNGILSTLNSGPTSPGVDTLAYYQGTSMATPHVAGVAALMLAVKSSLTPDQVESLLKSSARAFPVACSGCGTGIVNAAAAVAAAVNSSPTVTVVAEVERNNSLNRAQVITGSNVQVNGSLASTSDTDYFRVSIAPGATLTATLTSGSPTTGNADVAIYSTNGSLLAASSSGLGQVDSASLRNGNTTAYTAYVRVLRGSGSTATSFSYTLQLAQ
jgi:serine protease